MMLLLNVESLDDPLSFDSENSLTIMLRSCTCRLSPIVRSRFKRMLQSLNLMIDSFDTQLKQDWVTTLKLLNRLNEQQAKHLQSQFSKSIFKIIQWNEIHKSQVSQKVRVIRFDKNNLQWILFESKNQKKSKEIALRIQDRLIKNPCKRIFHLYQDFMRNKKEKKNEKNKRKFHLMFKWLETMLWEKKPKFKMFDEKFQAL